jgi:sulfur-oxidizing protein SoxX
VPGNQKYVDARSRLNAALYQSARMRGQQLARAIERVGPAAHERRCPRVISPGKALGALSALAGCMLVANACAAGNLLIAYKVEGGRIQAPLTQEAGDVARGRAAVLSRDAGNCFLCHSVPDAGETPLGNIGPPLAGVGKRLSAAQLRLRLVDSTRINRASVMPAYYRIQGLQRVAPAYSGKPLLTAQQVEDVIAYLLTLRN